MIIYQSKGEGIRILVTARINPNGDLVVDGVDHGPIVKRLQGDSDYEYALTIKAKDKSRLITYLQQHGTQIKNDEDLLLWLQQNYGHNRGFSALMNFCKEINIPFDSFFWA